MGTIPILGVIVPVHSCCRRRPYHQLLKTRSSDGNHRVLEEKDHSLYFYHKLQDMVEVPNNRVVWFAIFCFRDF